MQRPTFKKVWQHFLQTRSMPYHGDKIDEIVTDPIVSVSMTINTGPGAAAQLLHRDDMSWQIAHGDATQSGYSLGRDMCMAVLVPGVETTVENGATVVRSSLLSSYPGSVLSLTCTTSTYRNRTSGHTNAVANRKRLSQPPCNAARLYCYSAPACTEVARTHPLPHDLCTASSSVVLTCGQRRTCIPGSPSKRWTNGRRPPKSWRAMSWTDRTWDTPTLQMRLTASGPRIRSG